MKYYSNFILLNLLIIFSLKAVCQEKGKYSLTLIDSIMFDLPEYINDVQLIQNGSKEQLFFMHNNSLRYLDYDSKKINTCNIEFIPLSNVDGFKIIDSENVIFSLMNRGIESIIYANLKTKSYKEYKIAPDFKQCKYPPRIKIGFEYATLIKNNKLIISCQSGGEIKDEKPGDRPVFINLDLITGNHTYIIDFPEKYYLYNWAGLEMRSIYSLYNTHKNELIVSFPVCNEIYFYNLSGNIIKKINCQSIYFKDAIPLRKNKDWNGALFKNEYLKYYYKNYSFNMLQYDKYNKLYYRFVSHPNDSIDLGDFRTVVSKYSVIILDENFINKGEYDFKELKYQISSSFVSRKGLHIKYFNSKETSNGKVKYYIFKPVIK